jgi:uncharacterized membrane protein (DUF485 family)
MRLTRRARRASRSDTMRGVARLGLAARATIYLLIGWLALLLARGVPKQPTDQRGAMQEVVSHRGGSILLWIIAIGLIGYALWRWSEAAFGVVGEGRKMGPRVQSFVRGCIYAFFAFTAFKLLAHSAGKSQARQEQDWTAKTMAHSGGRLLVGAVGAVVIIAGVVLVREGITRKFEKYLELRGLTSGTQRIVVLLGIVGTIARGVVFAVTGVFVLRAALTYDASKARGLDGALRSLATGSGGPWLLGAAAVGLIVFGIYGYAEAIWRRT